MQRLGFATKTAYGSGQLAEGVKNGSFNLFLLFYFTNVLGLSGTLTGLALFLATSFDAITDPIAGSLSDRLRHRWGRRHPFMYASALPLGVSFALLFRPPAGLGEVGLFAWLLGFAVLVRGAMTLFHVPHLALGAELSSDYRERTTVVAYRAFYGATGMALVVGLAWLVFFRATPEFEQGQLDPSVYPGFGAFFGLVMTVTVLVSSLGTHHCIRALPRQPGSAPPFRAADLWHDYAGALRNRSFLFLFLGIVVFFVMRGVQEVLQVHMTTYFWALDQAEILAVSAASLPGFLLGIPLWSAISGRLDKKPIFLAGIAIFSLCVLLPPIARLAGWFPAAGSPAYLGLLALATFVATLGAAAGVVMAGSMLADVADEHELATGRRQEGIFFAALAFAGKSSSGLGSLLGGVSLDWIGFPHGAAPEHVPAETVDVLGVLYGPGIGALAVVSIALLARYAIDRRRHAEIVSELDRRRRAPSPA